MYFLVALGVTLIAVCLWLFVKTKKPLHFDILAIIFGAATTMWFIDCIASSIKGEGFLSFEIPLDIWISLWTIGGGLILYGIILLILFLRNKNKVKAE